MNKIPCPSCGSNNQNKLENYNEYELYKCNKCKLIFCYPCKNPGVNFYEKFYENIGICNPDRFSINSSEKLFFKRNKPGRLIDMGCGMGIFLYVAKNRHFDTYGIDFDQKSINICKNHFKLENVYQYSVDDKNIKQLGSFDYVSLIDVLEHVDDPNKLISGSRNLLKDNGLLIVSVPNYNRKPDFIFKEGDNPPHHLTKWISESLKFILEKNNFEVIFCEPLKFTSHDLVGYIRAKVYTKILDKINKLNRSQDVQDFNNKEFKSSLKNKILFKIRDLIIFIIAILHWPINFIVVKIFKFESDHIYAEARKK
jgi:SAM-dependent methyltransferase